MPHKDRDVKANSFKVQLIELLNLRVDFMDDFKNYHTIDEKSYLSQKCIYPDISLEPLQFLKSHQKNNLKISPTKGLTIITFIW